MLIISSLSIKNFKSFKNTTSFLFSSLPSSSLTFITGENKIEPELGANGSGKSSLTEALTWLLYGKTSTSLKAGNIANWDKEKEVTVSGEFLKEGKLCTIIRTWSPNSLQLSTPLHPLKTVTQEELEDFIGMNFPSFLFSTHIAQFTPKFFDLSPTEKLDVFTEVLGSELKGWDVLSDRFSGKVKEVEGRIKEIELQEARLQGKASSIPVNLEGEIKRWEEERDKKTTEIENEVKRLEDSMLSLMKSSDTDIEEVKQKKGTIETLMFEKMKSEEYVKKIQIENKTKENIYSSITKRLYEVNAELQQIERQIDKISKVKVGECPTCKQQVDVKHLQKEEEKLVLASEPFIVEVEELKEKESRVKKEIQGIKEEEEKGNKTIKTLQQRLNDLSSDLKMIEFKKSSKQKEMDTCKNRIEEGRNKINKVQNERNPYTKTLRTNRNKVRMVNKTLTYIKEELDLLKKTLIINKYWVKGFMRIKLRVLEESLKEVEIIINNVLSSIGLDGWKVILQIGSETKTGGIKEGLTVFIQSSHNTKLVPFESWSGGEGQRLRIAGTLGVCSFIRDRKGGGFDCVIMDEPTTWLSEDGIGDFLEVFERYVEGNGLKGVLVDHRSLESKGNFKKIVKVIKGERGSEVHTI